MKESLSFRIDGRYVTDLVRTMFWQENRPYETCEKLLLSCLETDELSLDERKRIARDILEYRYQLVGTNTLSLTDDPRPIRPISEKLAEYERTRRVAAIRQDMKNRPWAYLDPYATSEPFPGPKILDGICDTLIPAHRRQIHDVFGTHLWAITKLRIWAYSKENVFGMRTLESEFWEKSDDSFLKHGLYLINHPELVECLIGKPCDSLDDLAGAFTKWLEEYLAKENPSDEVRKEIRLRNAKYEADHMQLSKNHKKEKNSDIDNQTEPDDFLEPYGLIDPQGRYYSCTFGGHGVKAYHILSKESKDWQLTSLDEAQTELYKRGWAFIRNPNPWGDPKFSFGSDRSFDVDRNILPTKGQLNTAFEHMVRFKEYSLPGIEKYL